MDEEDVPKHPVVKRVRRKLKKEKEAGADKPKRGRPPKSDSES